MSDQQSTIFPLRMTFDEKKTIIDAAVKVGVNPDIPYALNSFLIKTIMEAISP